MVWSHSHTGSYDLWIIRLVAIWPRCDRSAMSATISYSGRMPRSICTRGGAITNDWRISMARAIAGNRATSGSDQWPMTINRDGRRPMVRSIDRCILVPIVRAIVADRTSTRDILWPSVRSIVAPEDRWYNQSWDATIDRTIDRSIMRPIVRSIVATFDRFRIAGTRFEHDHRQCCDWFATCDHPRPMWPVIRPFYDLSTIPNSFGRSYVVTWS